MAGGVVKYRHLSRSSAHRQALLRNLVTSLVKHESIRTTWAKAKETQRMADKLITLAKRNNETSRRKAHGILYVRSSHNSPPPSPGRLIRTLCTDVYPNLTGENYRDDCLSGLPRRLPRKRTQI